METVEFRTLVIALTGLFLLLGLFVLIFFAVYKKNQNRKELEIENLNRAILQTQLEIQEQTLKNISQEIHDNIGQALTLAKLNLNTMPAANDEQQQKITTTKELVSKAIVDLRDLSRSLNTDYILDMGLPKAVEYELGLISKAAAVTTNLHVNGEPFRPERQKELILFRIVQEVLNNIVKHAEAKNISAGIDYNDNNLELSITDDGKGFETEQVQQDAEAGTGLGLRNMQSRAKLIGAVFSISSADGKGTTVKIRLPKTPEDNGNSSVL